MFGDLTFRERYNDLLERTGRDMLTGVYDRTRMEMEAPLMVREALRQGHYATVLILDADHFKDVNDTSAISGRRGAEGDRRAGSARRCARTDRVFRFGGEEFVAVCSGDRS